MEQLKLNLNEKQTKNLNGLVVEFLDSHLDEMDSEDFDEAKKLHLEILTIGVLKNYPVHSELMDRIIANAIPKIDIDKMNLIDNLVRTIYQRGK